MESPPVARGARAAHARHGGLGAPVDQQPETGCYAIGAKSYGRAPTFLLASGYEQARSVVAALAGDRATARDLRLTLAETGVRGTDSVTVGGCCD